MNNDENVTILSNTGASSINISRNLAVPSSPLGFPRVTVWRELARLYAGATKVWDVRLRMHAARRNRHVWTDAWRGKCAAPLAVDSVGRLADISVPSNLLHIFGECDAVLVRGCSGQPTNYLLRATSQAVCPT
jgi:hypothetical protein